ncbi:MAG: KpsF/GutQ family sugar-phosphate isomerase [Erythrobacter sp.]|uniref:KpsF/GutQ family sugar-phosphate isomerase n=1 Tax=Erythrobacter sp. TaxID=1042 RepID=UPI0026166A6C|nr:KpsF/GutQ family sugar-phosphate isomerase [Erythrobacter sp.]MDJ0979724.1 KpsF/GutQ family sugar-phosphate isomerase [Erythrobacter sp.]
MNALTGIKAAHRADPETWFYQVIAQERDALCAFLRSRQPGIADALFMLAMQDQPVIFTGIGKSGHIAAKLAATFSSLGIAAFYLNAAEAAHGDLGIVQPRSAVVLVSNSGSTEEITRILPQLRSRECTLLGIVGRRNSQLARGVDHLVLAEIESEADHIGMAPTSSTTLHLAIGDALAVAVSRIRGFTREGFLRHHPAGLLGRQMIPVTTLMRQGDACPMVDASTDLLDLLAVMSAKRMGAACVIDSDTTLLGLVVDGDIRRHLLAGPKIAEVTAQELMQTDPQAIDHKATLGEVLALRKASKTDWLVLPVIDDKRRLKGLLHASDLQL